MQPPLDGPRSTLTLAQVVHLIQDAPSVTVSAGLELLDQNLNVIDDLTEAFAGGSITRNAYATLHATAHLAVSQDLDWGRAIVRPYLVLIEGDLSARFNLGAYYTSTPQTNSLWRPITHDIEGYDILHRLDTLVGESYVVASGVDYLDAIETILIDQGYTQYILDQGATGTLLTSDRAWPLDEQTTWLAIVNDLISGIGYQGIWSDWNGMLRVVPYERPQDRGVEWEYNAGQFTGMLTPERTRTLDLYNAPNRWVFFHVGEPDDPAPVEGAGIYTFTNENDGPTSVAERDGRVISKVIQVSDAAGQDALVNQAQITIDADLRLKTMVKLGTFPNPLHWHFDKVIVNDDFLGAYAEYLVTEWTLPLNGEDMTHEWSQI